MQPVLLEKPTARWRRPRPRSAPAGSRSFGGSCSRTCWPAILSGVALAFARAIGEFGSVVLISGNLPFDTEVASVYIFGRIESSDPHGAAAVSVVLLLISLATLLLIGGVRRRVTRHDRVG